MAMKKQYWQCNDCSAKLTIKYGGRDKISRHQKLHEDPDYYCPHCFGGFNTFKQRKCHIHFWHPGLSQPKEDISDEEEDGVQETKDKSKEDEDGVQETRDKSKEDEDQEQDPEIQYNCNDCSATFGSKTKLRVLEQHHESHVNPQFFCTYCGGGFKLNVQLKLHLWRWHQKESQTERQIKQKKAPKLSTVASKKAGTTIRKTTNS